MKTKSILCLLICYTVLLLTHFDFYPRWQQNDVNATISWDASGYYMYLPAHFIYDDIKECKFHEDILKKYKPTPNFQQAFKHSSGNYVMKYSIGQAVQFAPFFFIAHWWATNSPLYEADGFSLPYQFMISMGSLFIAFLGLFFFRKILLHYYSDGVVGVSLLAVVLGTNYLNYTAIDGAMTHNNLFTIYCLLIFTTIYFYKNPSYVKALLIGCLVGLAALTRPTEILSMLIPLFWACNFLKKEDRTARFDFLLEHKAKIITAVITCMLVGSLQLIYWKHVSGDWIVYSYEEQGFSWLTPHLIDGIFSYKSGWLVYSPILIFSLIGFYFLRKEENKLYSTCLLFSVLFIYITFAWDEWLYGGSLGIRAMIQAYPILMFPFSSFVTWLKEQDKVIQLFYALIFTLFCYMSCWFTYQAHNNGMMHVGKMTKAYYWKTLGTYKKNKEHLKLLDTKEIFEGYRQNVQVVYENNFEENQDTAFTALYKKVDKNSILYLNKDNQYSPEFNFSPSHDYNWIRVSADFHIKWKEWNTWKMGQLHVKFYKGEKVVRSRGLRVHRFLNNGDRKNIYLDIPKPWKSFDSITITFWNADSDKELSIDNLKAETFD